MGKAIVESAGVRHCPECGKEFFVQWPMMWTYARTEGQRRKYFCSWSCMRKYDNEKGEKKMGGRRKITKDQEKEAVRIALDGGDPLTFLEKCGIENPSQKWYDIKYAVKDSDPETYAKLPLRIQRKKEPEKLQKAETPEAPLPVQDLKLQPGGNYRISVETPEAPKIYKPVVYDGMTVREVEGGFGRYRRSDTKDSIYIDFEYADGVDVVSLTVDQWRSFRDEQLKAAMILGGGTVRNIRILPHPRVTVKEWDIDNKPASIIVELSDNSQEIYDRRIQQPEPKFKAVMDLIEKLPVYGPSAEGYKGRHEKKDR